VDYAETIIELFATKKKEGDRSECNFMLITQDAGFWTEKACLFIVACRRVGFAKRVAECE